MTSCVVQVWAQLNRDAPVLVFGKRYDDLPTPLQVMGDAGRDSLGGGPYFCGSKPGDRVELKIVMSRDS